jgi:CheY-like chemotaxis protein
VPHQAVLVVDDDALVRVTVAEMLAAAGIPVLAAGSAEEAAEKLSGRPALALVDLFLPGEQGDAFCRSVRLHPDLWDLPLVMITSDDRPESVRRCFLAGADDYLLKPLQERLLLAKIAAVRSPSAVHLAPPARHKRVLLSTERLFFGTVMGRLLEKAGYQVVRACVPRELDDLGPEPVALAIVDLDLPQAAPLVGRLQAASPAIAVVAVVSQKGAAALPRAL